MEPEGSSSHSQVPATCPYPEPSRVSPYTHILLPQDPFHYYSPIYAWVSQVVPFLQVSPPKACIRLSSHPYKLHAPSISLFSILSPKNIGWGVKIIKLLIMQLCQLPCYLVPLRPEYSPQHPFLKHPQPTFLPQCERPIFTPIQNNRQNYSSVYLNF